MLIKKIETTKGSLIGVWKIDESEEELLQQSVLSPTDLAKFKTFTSKRRRLEFLAVRSVLKALNCNFQIHYTERKPFIKEGNISISHSANLATVIINPALIVGIDIEQKRQNIFRVAKRVFTESELSQAAGKIELLTLLWNCKECVYKMINDENIDFREQIQVDISNIENIRCRLHYSNMEEVICVKSLVVEDNMMVYGEK